MGKLERRSDPCHVGSSYGGWLSLWEQVLGTVHPADRIADEITIDFAGTSIRKDEDLRRDWLIQRADAACQSRVSQICHGATAAQD